MFCVGGSDCHTHGVWIRPRSLPTLFRWLLLVCCPLEPQLIALQSFVVIVKRSSTLISTLPSLRNVHVGCEGPAPRLVAVCCFGGNRLGLRSGGNRLGLPSSGRAGSVAAPPHGEDCQKGGRGAMMRGGDAALDGGRKVPPPPSATSYCALPWLDGPRHQGTRA
jgi:hypothetical protein